MPQPIDDRSLVMPAHLAVLRETLAWPIAYNQRISEHVTFLPRGGQQWSRELQLLIPKVEGASLEDVDSSIVSLGVFGPRRFVDFVVTDCEGRNLNLLSRRQHGHSLATCLLESFFSKKARSRIDAALDAEDGNIGIAYGNVYEAAFNAITKLHHEQEMDKAIDMYRLLVLTGSPEADAKMGARRYRRALSKLATATQYLCWARARPGSVVRLKATFTLSDDFVLSSSRRSEGLARLYERWRVRRAQRYCRYGLSPFPYELSSPDASTASYYFSIEAPDDASVVYLDWESGNTLEKLGHDWVCAHSSLHLYGGSRDLALNGGSVAEGVEEPKEDGFEPPSEPGEADESSGSRDRRIVAAIRAEPIDSKQIVFAAMLNLVFVWLVEAGRLNSELDDSAAPWLALIPAVLIAYAAQHRRNYFAGHTRRIRALIWFYLGLNLAFIVSIAFDIAPSGSLPDRGGLSDDLASIVMATASLGVIALFLMMGRRSHDLFIRLWFALSRRRAKRESIERPPTAEVYATATRTYGNLTAALAIVLWAVMAAVVLTGSGPDGEQRRVAPEPKPRWASKLSSVSDLGASTVAGEVTRT